MNWISRIGGWSLAVLMLATWVVPARAAESDAELATALKEGRIDLVRGENESALTAFRHAVEISAGKSFPAWQGVTGSLLELQRYDEAVESAKQARSLAALPKEQSAAVSQLVGALLLANRAAEATEVLRAYRATGAVEGDVQLLLCHVGQSLAARRKDTVNDRLLALDTAAPLRVGEKVQKPQILEHAPPLYTPEARQARLQGTVILQAVVGAGGRVEGIEVLKGLPMGLDEKAIDAVKQWTFQPATLDGAPVPVCYVLTVNFQMDDRPQSTAGEAPRN